jgi:hypothetical protein
MDVPGQAHVRRLSAAGGYDQSHVRSSSGGHEHFERAFGGSVEEG